MDVDHCEALGISKVEDRCAAIKMNWAGFESDIGSIRVTERVTREGKCSDGRQKTRWGGEIRKLPVVDWNGLAQDRSSWRLQGQASFLQRT